MKIEQAKKVVRELMTDKLVKIAKSQPKTPPNKIQGFSEMMAAIKIVEEL